MMPPVKLGVGLDLPWGQVFGLDPNVGGPSPRVASFLDLEAASFDYFVFSFQPRGAYRMRVDNYVAAYRNLLAHLPTRLPVSLHQTALNLAAIEDYDRSTVIEFSNEMVGVFDLQWVVEDLGLWSIEGFPLPYPWPPILSGDSLEAIRANVSRCADDLTVPLHVEFPGFNHTLSPLLCGDDVDPNHYRFFADALADTGAFATLDVGHLLSYRWLQGHRGDALFDEIEMLPLDRVRELHLSGCSIVRDVFIDGHHGWLLDEQFELAARLMDCCPRLEFVTYEDPRFDAGGHLTRTSQVSFDRLSEVCATANVRRGVAA